MKSGLLMFGCVCITAVLTFSIFLRFQKKQEAASTFQTLLRDTPLSLRIQFIAPERLGVHAWNSGDTAVYKLKTNMESRHIRFHISSQVASSDTIFWMTTQGLFTHNNVDIGLWSLASVKSYTSGQNSVLFSQGGIPFSIQIPNIPSDQVILEPIGEQLIETSAGALKCQRYFVHIQGPDGTRVPLLELWANASATPLGIVRARWRDEVMELIEADKQQTVEIPGFHIPALRTQVEQPNLAQLDTAPVSVCSQCHADMSGSLLKMESLTALSGTELDLTQVLYHIYASELAHPDEPFTLHLVSKHRKPLTSLPLRFSSRKGSFRVKTDTSGALTFSLDEIAHQENIRVSTTKGSLILNTSGGF